MCDWSPQASGEGSGYEEPRSPQATGEKPRMTVWNNFEFIILLFYFKKGLTTSTCCCLFSSMTLSEVSFTTLLSALILLGTWYWNIMFYHFLIGKLCKTIKSRYEAVRRRMKKTVFPEGVSKQPIEPGTRSRPTKIVPLLLLLTESSQSCIHRWCLEFLAMSWWTLVPQEKI